MNLAFWSSFRHRSGVTTSVAVISVLWKELYKDEIAVTSNHISSQGVLPCLKGGKEYRKRLTEKPYCYHYGEPEYFRWLYETGDRYEVKLCGGMEYVSMPGDEEEQMFCGCGLRGVEQRVKEMDYLMIDTASGCGSNSLSIIQESHLVIVVLPPQKDAIDDFFRSDSNLRQKGFFILGKYKTAASCWPSYLTKKYKIPKERIGVIPYDSGLGQAMWNGDTAAYILSNINCSPKSEAYSFMRYLTKTTQNLRKYAMERRSLTCADYAEVSKEKSEV